MKNYNIVSYDLSCKEIFFKRMHVYCSDVFRPLGTVTETTTV